MGFTKIQVPEFSLLSDDGYCIYFILKLQISFVAISVNAIFGSENKKSDGQNHKPDKI